jgi:hypothetical protein
MSPLDPPRKIAPSLDVIPFLVPPRESEDLCTNCRAVLYLIQPDAELPDRLLGVCKGCKHWYLIDTVPDVSEGTMVRLPDVHVIRSLSRMNPSDGISPMSDGPGDDQPGTA